MARKDSVRRIAAACANVARRSDEVVRRADAGDAALAALFAKKEIRVTNEICCELLLAVAESESVADLAANRANFERMRRHVMDANDVLLAHTQVNPQTMSSIMNAEDTLIDLLVAADPTVRLAAGFAQRYLGVVKSVLTSFFTDIALQLGARGGVSALGRRLRGALAAPVGAVVRRGSEDLLEQYGDDRCDRASAIAFMRTLYDKDDPRRCSWPKVVRYVQTCRDESDANFTRCADIRAQVQTWAKPVKGGAVAVWNSLTQQLKLSHGKKPKSGLGPCAVPDRSWC